MRVHDLAPLSDGSLCLVFEVEGEMAELPVPATCPPPQLQLWFLLLETKANPSSAGSCLGCGFGTATEK